MSATENDPTRVTLKNVRLSFPTLREKKATVKDGKLKFSSNFILDPTTPHGKKNIELCKAAIAAAELKEFKKPGQVKLIEDPKRIAFRQGAKFRNQDGEVYEGYEGMVAIACNADKRPQLWDRQKNEIELEEIEDVFQAGFFCDAVVRFYCVSGADKGGRGLFCAVNAIRSRQVGETFSTGGRVSADVFDDLEDEDDGDLTSAEADDDDDLLG